MSAPANSQFLLERMIALLASHTQGLSAAELACALFGTSTDSTKRRVRALASEARPIVVSAPAVGYVHISHARPETVNHCINSLRSQARSMASDAEQYERALAERSTPQQLLAL